MSQPKQVANAVTDTPPAKAHLPAERVYSESLVYDPTELGGAYWTNIDTSKPHAKDYVINVLTDAVPAMDAVIGQTIELHGVVCHPVEFERDGELISAVRIVLVDADAKAWQCVSHGVLKSLRRIMAPDMYGQGPWIPPLRVRMKQIPVSGGKRYYVLTVVTDDKVSFRDPKAATKKGGAS